MNPSLIDKPRRGRPRKQHALHTDTRMQLIRSGMELLTERGYSATGIDSILKPAGIPKGSFYHYFASKDQFVIEVIRAYAEFFRRLLDTHLGNQTLHPLDRISAFMQAATEGMARFNFRRGCLLGNLGQEMNALPEHFRFEIESVFADWESRLNECLLEAQSDGSIPASTDTAALAYLFWVGWEGAVLRAKLERSERPVTLFSKQFIAGMQTPLNHVFQKGDSHV